MAAPEDVVMEAAAPLPGRESDAATTDRAAYDAAMQNMSGLYTPQLGTQTILATQPLSLEFIARVASSWYTLYHTHAGRLRPRTVCDPEYNVQYYSFARTFVRGIRTLAHAYSALTDPAATSTAAEPHMHKFSESVAHALEIYIGGAHAFAHPSFLAESFPSSAHYLSTGYFEDGGAPYTIPAPGLDAPDLHAFYQSYAGAVVTMYDGVEATRRICQGLHPDTPTHSIITCVTSTLTRTPQDALSVDDAIVACVEAAFARNVPLDGCSPCLPVLVERWLHAHILFELAFPDSYTPQKPFRHQALLNMIVQHIVNNDIHPRAFRMVSFFAPFVTWLATAESAALPRQRCAEAGAEAGEAATVRFVYLMRALLRSGGAGDLLIGIRALRKYFVAHAPVIRMHDATVYETLCIIQEKGEEDVTVGYELAHLLSAISASGFCLTPLLRYIDSRPAATEDAAPRLQSALAWCTKRVTEVLEAIVATGIDSMSREPRASDDDIRCMQLVDVISSSLCVLLAATLYENGVYRALLAVVGTSSHPGAPAREAYIARCQASAVRDDASPVLGLQLMFTVYSHLADTSELTPKQHGARETEVARALFDELASCASRVPDTDEAARQCAARLANGIVGPITQTGTHVGPNPYLLKLLNMASLPCMLQLLATSCASVSSAASLALHRAVLDVLLPVMHLALYVTPPTVGAYTPILRALMRALEQDITKAAVTPHTLTAPCALSTRQHVLRLAVALEKCCINMRQLLDDYIGRGGALGRLGSVTSDTCTLLCAFTDLALACDKYLYPHSQLVYPVPGSTLHAHKVRTYPNTTILCESITACITAAGPALREQVPSLADRHTRFAARDSVMPVCETVAPVLLVSLAMSHDHESQNAAQKLLSAILHDNVAALTTQEMRMALKVVLDGHMHPSSAVRELSVCHTQLGLLHVVLEVSFEAFAYVEGTRRVLAHHAFLQSHNATEKPATEHDDPARLLLTPLLQLVVFFMIHESVLECYMPDAIVSLVEGEIKPFYAAGGLERVLHMLSAFPDSSRHALEAALCKEPAEVAEVAPFVAFCAHIDRLRDIWHTRYTEADAVHAGVEDTVMA